MGPTMSFHEIMLDGIGLINNIPITDSKWIDRSDISFGWYLRIILARRILSGLMGT
jgi:hypothetical protein